MIPYDDLLAALYAELETSVAALSPVPEVRFPNADYSTSTATEWLYLELTMRSSTARSPAASSDGSFLCELWARPTSSDAYRMAEISEAIRAHFAQRTLEVFGTASGAPSTSRGVVDVTSITVQSLGAAEGELIFQLEGTWQERG